MIAMIAVNDLRQGVLFERDGRVYQVQKFATHKMARGKGIVNITTRDVQSGGVKEFSFKSSESVDDADVEHRTFEFVYFDERKNEVVLSDLESKKRVTLTADTVSVDIVKYLKAGVEITALVGENPTDIYTVTIPKTVELEVTSAPPNDKGDTASGGTKPVEVETGLTVNTPFFIKSGDLIKVNTDTGEYVERVSS